MKKTVLCLALLGLLALGGQALAVICTIDDVPAATLLLPYFEVDLSNPNGVTTLFSVNNASATAVLAHVVVWSDLSVPVLDFNIYLTGYDVQTINLRDILTFGGVDLPQTASAAQDTGEAEPNPAPTPTAISNQGAFSDDVTFASCNGQLPPPPLPQNFIDHLQNSLTGRPSAILGNLCAGRNLGDNVARGYVTVDTVDTCTLLFPGDPGYFGTTGAVTNQNVLWGDYFYVDTANNFAQGETLVHIEAAPGEGTSSLWGTYGPDPETTTPGEYTFYGRYVAWLATDNREPLSTNFATRFATGGTFTGGTDLLCWRDSKVAEQPFPPTGGNCVVPNANVPWFPLGQEGVVIFDEEENPDVPTSFPVSPQPPTAGIQICPAETQRVAVGGSSFPVPFDFGWLYLNLNTFVTAAGSNPPEDDDAAQAWVTTVMDALGRFSVGFDAVQLDSACNALHFTPGGGD
jgi:hypothetical protein